MHAIQLQDGQTIPEWVWLVTPDFVNVIAVTQDGRFLCFQQNKYAIEGLSLAPVGGYIDPGETSWSLGLGLRTENGRRRSQHNPRRIWRTKHDEFRR
jgi:hypothetical protein